MMDSNLCRRKLIKNFTYGAFELRTFIVPLTTYYAFQLSRKRINQNEIKIPKYERC